jgi:peroxiredoxin
MSKSALFNLLSDPDTSLAIFQSAIREEIELHRIEKRAVVVMRDGQIRWGMVEEFEPEDAAKKALEASA